MHGRMDLEAAYKQYASTMRAVYIKRSLMKILISLFTQLILCCVLLFITTTTYASTNIHVQNTSTPSLTNTYSKIGQNTGVGSVVNWAVGPGSNGQGQQVYISYKYVNDSFDLVEADPYSGNFQVHSS